MICETQSDGFANNGSGCNNISVTLSDGYDIQMGGDISPKKASFFDNLIRWSPSTKKVKSASNTWNIFSKKAAPKQKEAQGEVKEDEELAKFIEQLELEGKSEAEIKLHLSFINEVHTPPATPPTPKSKNIVSQFFSDVQQVFKEIGFEDEDYIFPEEREANLQGLTIRISSAPFYGALPPDMDMSFEELASLEPVYVGSRCINNLPSCTHDGSPLPGDQVKCSVCLCDFSEGETLKSLPCVHFFHRDCIDTWLMVGHTCPLCKTLVE